MQYGKCFVITAALAAALFSSTVSAELPRQLKSDCPLLTAVDISAFNTETLSLFSLCSDNVGTVGISLKDSSGKELLTVGGSELYPLMSVYKFHIAYAAALAAAQRGFSLNDITLIDEEKAAAYESIYSPLRDRLFEEKTEFPYEASFAELIHYAVALSDNLAGDLLAERAGGFAYINHELGTSFKYYEAEMAADPERSFDNAMTPQSVSESLRMFMQDNKADPAFKQEILKAMRFAPTGKTRIQSGVMQALSDVALPLEIFDKTGTGAVLNGRRIAVNDAAVIRVGQKEFYLTVLIKQGPATEGYAEAEAKIRMIGERIFSALKAE